MTDLVVTIYADLPGVLEDHRQENVHIPPGYTEADVRQLIGVTLGNIGDHMLAEHELPRPVRTTLLGNAARLNRLEQLVTEFFQDHSLPSSVLDRLRELSLVDAAEAIERWGDLPIESEGDLVPQG